MKSDLKKASQAYVLNAFANSSNSFSNPLFHDKSFELIPIPEHEGFEGEHLQQYRNLNCFNNPKCALTNWIYKEKLHSHYVHNDPDFVDMTYGDSFKCRSETLKHLHKEDWLVFLAMLTPYHEEVFHEKDKKIHLVGMIQVKTIVRQTDLPKGISPEERRTELINQFEREDGERILKNAHGSRWLQNPDWSHDLRLIVVGSEASCRFKRPLLVDRKFCDIYFRTAEGKEWDWEKGSHTELQRIGSYLRAVHKVADSEKFLKRLHQHNTEL